jgi:hypothetical protein
MNRVHTKVQTTPAMPWISDILNKMNSFQYITGVLFHHSPSAKKKKYTSIISVKMLENELAKIINATKSKTATFILRYQIC